MDESSSRATVCLIIVAIISVLLISTCFLCGELRTLKREAVLKGYAHYMVDEDGKTEWVWVEKEKAKDVD